MSKIVLRKFQQDDTYKVQLRDEIRGLYTSDIELWRKNILQLTGENSFTGLFRDEIVGFGGVHDIWPGVGECWVVFNLKFINKPKLLFENTKKVFSAILGTNQYHRLQATCRVDVPITANFLEHLGFEIESVLHKFGTDKADFFMYAKVQE